MPAIFLSPSVQEYNAYAGGGNEEDVMNQIADAMEPYLRSTGIRFTRNDPDQTVGAAIRQSNAGNYDLHLALHSNASPPALAGKLRGTDVYYSPNSVRGVPISLLKFAGVFSTWSFAPSAAATISFVVVLPTLPVIWIKGISKRSR